MGLFSSLLFSSLLFSSSFLVFPVSFFIIFQKACGLFSVSAIIFSSQLAFFHWARFIVFFFCLKYAVLHSSIFSSFPVFLAYLHCLLSFDLSSILSMSSLSTQGAALKCWSL